MKNISIILFFCIVTAVSQAQSSFNKGFRVGGGITLAIPAANLSGYSIGAGIDLLGQLAIAQSLAITGDIGYTTIFAKNKDLASFDILPIRVGLRYFPSEKFYLGAKIGAGIGAGKSSGSSTAYAFGAGLVMSPKLDVSANYEGYSKSGVSPGYIGIRLGYFFN